MLRRSLYAPAVAIAACGLLVAIAPASSAPAASASVMSASVMSASVTPASVTPASAVTVSAGTAPTFTAVAFPTATAGWLLGTAGGSAAPAEVLHTTTAGASWQVQWLGAGSPLAITATDAGHAWALIGCPQHQSCGRELLGTTDGGRHWRLLATLPEAVNLVQFASDRSGTLGLATSDACLADLALPRCPGQVLVSRDGGTRWTPVLSGAGPVFATATATGQLWAAQTYPAPPGQSQPQPNAIDIRFLTSTDGGHSWRRLGSFSGLGLLSPGVKVTLAATPAGLAWASVFDPLSCAMHGCAVADLLSSDNGGRSWSSVNLPDVYPDECGPDGLVFSAVPGGGAWAAIGRNGAACAPPFGLLYRYPGPVTPWQQLSPWQLTQVSALDAVSGREAFAISDQGVLSVTFDGGALWTQLLPAPAPVGQVDAVTATTALAAQDQTDAGAILRTGDGGRSWSQVFQLPGVVTQLDFWSASDGVAATYQPDTPSPWQLFASSDGGSSWAPYGPLPGGGADIYGPWMSADGHGLLLTVTGGTPWVVSSGGVPPVRVWTTSDYGLNWDRGGLLPLGRDSVAGSASFVYVGGPSGWTGWMVVFTASYAQRVAAVTTGSLRLLSSSLPANNVQLLGRGVGFVWGLQYPGNNANVAVLALYRTVDNGSSWQHADIRLVIPASSTASPLLDFTDADHGWLVLGNATWHTSDGGRTWQRA